MSLTLMVLGSGACGDDGNAAEADSGSTTGDEGGPGAGSHGEGSSDTAAESLDQLSDEFDQASSLDAWTLREEVDGGPSNWDVLDVDDTTPGQLTMQPVASGWYGGYVGPMLFKHVTGDFAVETAVRASSLDDPETPPSRLFNAGGLIVRNPDSGSGVENYVVHNVGRQLSTVATEGKTTRDSGSTLELVDGIHHGRLRICRIGDSFLLTRRLDDESRFRQTHRYDREDLPDTVQVGLMANGWNASGGEPDTSVSPDVEVTFDYVRFWRPDGEADCLAD